MDKTPNKTDRVVKPRVGFSFCLDLGMFLLVCALMCVALTGLTLHEWLGFVLCILVLIHLALHWRWFTGQVQPMLISGAYRARINFSLNIALLVMMAVLLLSGILISHQLAPLVGERFGRTQGWSQIHNGSSIVVSALASCHLGLNWDWILAALRRRNPDRAPAGVTGALSPSGCSSYAAFIAGGFAIAGIAALVAFATYFRTAGMELFASTLLGVLVMAAIVRYVFRIRL
jgi:cytochrome b561